MTFRTRRVFAALLVASLCRINALAQVHALNHDLYAHLTTGATSNYFPVPPYQNVIGGYGAVGAWVKRSVPLN